MFWSHSTAWAGHAPGEKTEQFPLRSSAFLRSPCTPKSKRCHLAQWLTPVSLWPQSSHFCRSSNQVTCLILIRRCAGPGFYLLVQTKSFSHISSFLGCCFQESNSTWKITLQLSPFSCLLHAFAMLTPPHCHHECGRNDRSFLKWFCFTGEMTPLPWFLPL